MNRTLERTLEKNFRKENAARNAWIAFGSLIALGIVFMTVREIPSMRRELRLLRM